MKKLLTLVLLAGISQLSHAESNQQSIMFKEATTQPSGISSQAGNDLGDHCQRLAKDIDNAKGKPQRRYALSERYRQECEVQR